MTWFDLCLTLAAKPLSSMGAFIAALKALRHPKFAAARVLLLGFCCTNQNLMCCHSETIRVLLTSYLNLDNPADHEVADGLQNNATHQQDVADGIVKERMNEFRAEDIENC